MSGSECATAWRGVGESSGGAGQLGFTAENDDNVKWLWESLGDMATGTSRQSFLIWLFFLSSGELMSVILMEAREKIRSWKGKEKYGENVSFQMNVNISNNSGDFCCSCIV